MSDQLVALIRQILTFYTVEDYLVALHRILHGSNSKHKKRWFVLEIGLVDTKD